VSAATPLYPGERRPHRIYRGLTKRQELVFTWVGVVVVLLYIAGWIGALSEARRIHREAVAHAKAVNAPLPRAVSPARQVTDAVLGGAPTTAYMSDAMLDFVDPLRGSSGKVLFTTRKPGGAITTTRPGEGSTAVLSHDGTVVVSPEFAAPAQPGVYDLAVKVDQVTRQVDDFSVITLVPFAQKQRGRIGLYYLGSWPFENGGRPKTAAYANPEGFIEVTRENQDTAVSEHFHLRDFLTKTQYDVWPKYLLLNPKLIDKLELTIAELERTGHPVRNMHVMSGFRTPQYNVSGGNTQGRANLSRHMYGDASDVFVDNDGNGTMDDLNHDGRVDTRDAEIVSNAADRVEQQHPDLVGGVGVYSACCGHGPFTHIDVRGYRARWRGTGNG
jgi:hypothetical protein